MGVDLPIRAQIHHVNGAETPGFRFEARTVEHDLATARHQSPLRYPGGKTRLAPTIARLVETAKASSPVDNIELFVEPFAGGASVALYLVGRGIVDRILLADADPSVAAFWMTAAADTSYLIDRMWHEYNEYVGRGGGRAVARWDHWRAWEPQAGSCATTVRRELAVQTMFLNRTTFSGILHGGAGPVGGRDQESKYGIGARFNPENLARRLRFVEHLYDQGRIVDVWCKDWKDTMRDVAEQHSDLLPSKVLAYVDPPYVEKATNLYQHSFAGVDHHDLSSYLRTEAPFRWILSYDNHPDITSEPKMYSHDQMTPSREAADGSGVRAWSISKRLVSLNYSASANNGRGANDELLMTTLPPATVPTSDELRLLS